MAEDTVGIGNSTATPGKKKHKLAFPTAFTILFALTIIAIILTWIVPAGSYSKLSYVGSDNVLQMVEPDGTIDTMEATQETLDSMGVKIGIDQFTSGAINKPISVPGTYETVPSNKMGVGDITLSMVNGTIEAVDIMVFIFVLGGLIGVVNSTGAFESGLVALTKKTKGREFILVFFVAVFMLLGGTMVGLEEEAVAFYPILVPIFLALGYDSIICVGAIFLASSMGTTMSTINPFSVVIASNAAGIDFTQGLIWRVVGLIAGGAFVIGYLYIYGKKVRKNPESSITWEDHEHFKTIYSVSDGVDGNESKFTLRKKIILVLFIAAFVIMVVGVMNLGWWFPQMASAFLAIAIICMFISGESEKKVVNAFIDGASSLVGVSLIIGLARGINLVLNDGLISDTILYASSNAVAGLSGPVFILMMLLIFFVLGFVVPSSSGLAVLSMPIMAPLADTVGIPRFVIVCAYQWGQYAMLYLAPTGLVLATLQMLDMKYSHWVKFVWPVVCFTLVFGGAMLVAMTLIYGV